MQLCFRKIEKVPCVYGLHRVVLVLFQESRDGQQTVRRQFTLFGS